MPLLLQVQPHGLQLFLEEAKDMPTQNSDTDHSLCLGGSLPRGLPGHSSHFSDLGQMPALQKNLPRSATSNIENHSRHPTPQFSSVTQLCPTLCDPMDCCKPGFPVHHHLLEFAQTYVHQVSDTIQPSHPLLFPSPPALNLSQHQGLFQ